MKIDQVMWTLNGGETLEEALFSIDRAISPDRSCHRIIVDGGSRDDTRSISERNGWQFFTCRGGIADQANYALSRVDTSLYASFEQDILLSPLWLERMERAIESREVAVAQGLRLSRGSRPIEAMERWALEHNQLLKGMVSIDNNLYRTDIIRKLGGYPRSRPGEGNWPDGLLFNNVFRNGYKWVVDPECISGHFRPSFWGYVRHFIGFSRRRVWHLPGESPYRHYARLLFSPLRGAEIARAYHVPSVLAAYPILRYAIALSSVTGAKLPWNPTAFGVQPDRPS